MKYIDAIGISAINYDYMFYWWSGYIIYNSLGKYQIQSRRKEQLYTKDKTALNVILSNCTKLRTGQPGCIWGKYRFPLMKMLRFYRNSSI